MPVPLHTARNMGTDSPFLRCISSSKNAQQPPASQTSQFIAVSDNVLNPFINFQHKSVPSPLLRQSAPAAILASGKLIWPPATPATPRRDDSAAAVLPEASPALRAKKNLLELGDQVSDPPSSGAALRLSIRAPSSQQKRRTRCRTAARRRAGGLAAVAHACASLQSRTHEPPPAMHAAQ